MERLPYATFKAFEGECAAIAEQHGASFTDFCVTLHTDMGLCFEIWTSEGSRISFAKWPDVKTDLEIRRSALRKLFPPRFPLDENAGIPTG